METITLVTVIGCIGVACLFIGTVFGFLLGATGRLIFRYGAKEFIRENMAAAEDSIQKYMHNTQVQCNVMVANANAQAAEVYKKAAMAAGGVSVPPKSRLN